MLHILWMLLKIIGILLLALPGFLILAVGIVLVVPLRYRGEASASGSVESIRIYAKFSWLLHLVSGFLLYEDGNATWQVRVLWRKRNSDKPVREKQKAEETTEVEKSVEVKESEKVEKTEEAEDRVEAEEATKTEKTKEAEEITGKKESETTGESAERTKKQKFSEKIKYTIQNICDKIRLCKEKKEDLQDFLTDEIHLSSWKRLKQEMVRLLKFLRPQKLIGNLHFGFEDPSVTGKVLAVLGALYPFYGEHICINPDFENEIFEGDVLVKGSIRGVYALIIAWNLFFDKNIRTTYKDLQKWKT